MKPMAVAQPLLVSTSNYGRVAAILVLTANILQRGDSPQPKEVNEPAAHCDNHVCDEKTPSNSHVKVRVTEIDQCEKQGGGNSTAGRVSQDPASIVQPTKRIGNLSPVLFRGEKDGVVINAAWQKSVRLTSCGWSTYQQ